MATKDKKELTDDEGKALVEEKELEAVRKALASSDKVKVTIRPEDRLAATLNQRQSVVQQWVQAQEQLDTAEMMADEESGAKTEDTRNAAKQEIKQILQASRSIYYKLKVLTAKVVKYAKESEHPLRADLRRGMPEDLRKLLPASCFEDAAVEQEEAESSEEGA